MTVAPWGQPHCSGAIQSTKPRAKHAVEMQAKFPEQKEILCLTIFKKCCKTHLPNHPASLRLTESTPVIQGMARFSIPIQQMGKLRHGHNDDSPQTSELLLQRGQGRSPCSDPGTCCLRAPAHTPSEGTGLWGCYAAQKELALSLNMMLSLLFPRSHITANNWIV